MPAQRIPVGLVGPSSHTNQDHQSARTLNLYPEANDPDAKAPAALFSAPGLLEVRDLALDVPTAGEIRGLIVTPKAGRLFVVAGNTLLEVRPALTPRSWGTLPTHSGPVGLSANGDVILVGDGAGFWAFDLLAGTVTAITDGVDPLRGWFSAYLDGRTLYLEAGSDRFAWSAIGDPSTVDGLSFATAEGNPDPALAMFVVNREIAFLGTASIEFWGPTSDVDNPYQRISGGYRELGCAARFAASPFADLVVFIGQDRSGHAQVYLQGPAGGQAQPISTHAVERELRLALRNYDPDQLRAFEYTEPGHKFWVLNLPDGGTWAYDHATGLWCERGELDAASGLFVAGRQEHHAFWQGDHYVGGQGSAKLYIQSRRYFDLAGDPLVRLRETPHLHAQGRAISFSSLTVDMGVGVGLDGTGQGADPQLMLQYSDDGGDTWSNEITRAIGKLGATRTRVQFGPTGRSVDRVYRFSVSDPVGVVFVAAWADVVIGG